MQKIIFRDQIGSYADFIDQSIIDYISAESIETYESFADYSLIAFDWYDLDRLSSPPAQIIIYLDREDVFFICENQTSFDVTQALFQEAESNERAVYQFFRNLFKGDAHKLERMEDKISALDDSIMAGHGGGKRERIAEMKYETLRLKKFYEPLESVFESLCDNDNGLISDGELKRFEVLRSRAADLLAQTMNLREYISQVRESYQAQIGIEQNDLMKLFTLVTSIFLPLTLLVGWYGMNFSMPEFGWRFGYAGVIAVTLIICAVWFLVFKRKNWFK